MIDGLDRVLVMGARGGVGRRVLDELRTAGVAVRASARSLTDVSFPAGVEAVAADLAAPASLVPAFDGVARVFLYAVPGAAVGVVDAARAAGVQRIVLMSSGSVLVPTCASNPITVEHRDIESAFAVTGAPELVPIRPLVLATNTLWWAREIVETSTVRLYRPDALMAPVHEADIAAVAAVALTAPAATDVLSGVLTGPEQLSYRDQVGAIDRAIGRKITVHEQTRDEALARLSRFVPKAEADAILSFYDDTAAGNSPSTDTVPAVLGRPALDFDAWALDHATDFG